MRIATVLSRIGHDPHLGVSFVAPDTAPALRRTFDPRTNLGWEAEGIAPDVSVPAGKALETALDPIEES